MNPDAISPVVRKNDARDYFGVKQPRGSAGDRVATSAPSILNGNKNPTHPTWSSKCTRTTSTTYDTEDYQVEFTGLLVIDPYNDFISEGGKIWDRVKAVAESNNCVPHMLQVLNAARQAGLRVFYALHRRYRPGDFETWKSVAPIQQAAWVGKVFEYGTWGGEVRAEFAPQSGDLVAMEHSVLERLCQHGFGPAIEDTRHSQDHRDRTGSQHVRRSHGSLRGGNLDMR